MRAPDHRRPRQPGSCGVPGETARRPTATKSSWCGAHRTRSISRSISRASRRRCSSVRRSTISACSELLDAFVDIAPAPQPRATTTREVEPHEEKFTGFVFKIQANMDPSIATASRSCASAPAVHRKGMKAVPCAHRQGNPLANALTFMAADREHAEEAYAGDIIGLHNHGTIYIGDTFTEGETLRFTGIPNFAPELFRRARPARSAAHQGAAEGTGAAVRGRRDPVLPAAAQQRPDPRRGRHAAVRCGRVPPEGRIQAWMRVRDRSTCTRRAGCTARTRRSSRSSATRPTTTWRSTTPARWSTWRRPASTCS